MQKFNYVVCSIEETNNVETLTVYELQSSLLIHEQRMKGSNEEEQALKVTHEERYERGIGKGIIRGRGGQFASRVAVECYMCRNLGHYQYKCPTWEKRVNYVEFNEEEEMLMMAHVDSHRNKKKRVWFLDPGCSNHMSKNKEWFIQLHESFKYSVKLGNKSKLEVMRKGNVILKFGESTQIVSEVFFIHELCNNLLSIGPLQDRGITIVIKHEVCKLYHPSRGCIRESLMTTNKIFLVITNILISTPTCFIANVDDLGEIWHKRFGHLSYKNLVLLHNKNFV